KRNGVQIATPTTTIFADTGLSVATTYTYTVAARDAVGNTSTAASASVTLTDTTAPSQPGSFTAAAAGSTGANLSWTASTDNVGVTSYVLKRNGVQIAAPTTTTFVDTGLSAATTYTYTVAARDAAGNTSTAASASVTLADTTAPSQPASFTAAPAGATAVNLSWGASTDNVGVTGYIVKRNGTQIATPTATSFADTGLTAATTYTYTVVARDAAGNQSTAAGASATTSTLADTTAPSQPGSFTAAAPGSTGANLSWTASTDNVGVTGYVLKRNGVQIATPTATTFADTGLTAATTYTYTVAARDAAGNTSTAASASVTTAPTPPSNSATLTWDAVLASNLSGYRVYFGTAPGTYLQPLGQGVSVGNVTTYIQTGLSSATRYYFAVTATDSIGDESGYSNEVFKDIP
ncbi:MAG TPA: fibronectin type III domain-containing protein, partial [Mycobacterium sp.]|nr:fibronectin type III domain-containing protein [Mycobacterium sp.]